MVVLFLYFYENLEEEEKKLWWMTNIKYHIEYYDLKLKDIEDRYFDIFEKKMSKKEKQLIIDIIEDRLKGKEKLGELKKIKKLESIIKYIQQYKENYDTYNRKEKKEIEENIHNSVKTFFKKYDYENIIDIIKKLIKKHEFLIPFIGEYILPYNLSDPENFDYMKETLDLYEEYENNSLIDYIINGLDKPGYSKMMISDIESRF